MERQSSKSTHTIETYAALFRAHRVPLTRQRRVVLEAVVEREDHPTADQIFEEVRGTLPRISRMTVYRVLETFKRIGLIRHVHHAGPVIRFDPNVARHHHVVCERCDKMIDLKDPALDRLKLPPKQPYGFAEISDVSVYFMGVCESCRRTEGRGP
ncbi:MAG: transcriptional repressor [Myxococcales bacterium]|nr:transcriptional repressor [Myxococcales bacterium]